MRLVTEKATIQCVHGAQVSTRATQHFVTVGGGALLTLPAPAGATIAGCINNNPQAGLKPCLVAAPPTVGGSTLVRIAGQPCLLDAATGLTDGTPVAMYRVVDAGQSQLAAAS